MWRNKTQLIATKPCRKLTEWRVPATKALRRAACCSMRHERGRLMQALRWYKIQLTKKWSLWPCFAWNRCLRVSSHRGFCRLLCSVPKTKKWNIWFLSFKLHLKPLRVKLHEKSNGFKLELISFEWLTCHQSYFKQLFPGTSLSPSKITISSYKP